MEHTLREIGYLKEIYRVPNFSDFIYSNVMVKSYPPNPSIHMLWDIEWFPTLIFEENKGFCFYFLKNNNVVNIYFLLYSDEKIYFKLLEIPRFLIATLFSFQSCPVIMS